MEYLFQPVKFTDKDLGHIFVHEIICYGLEFISQKNNSYIDHLKKTYDYVKTFSQKEEVIHFLKEAETSIHLIIFGNQLENIEEEISNINNISDIYLFGDNVLDQKRREDSKITFIGNKFEDLFLALRRSLMRVDFPHFFVMGSFGFDNKTSYSQRNDIYSRKEENIRFMDLTNKKLCSNQAYQIYNEKKISDFTRDHEKFSSKNILKWYANDPFIRRIGNFSWNTKPGIKIGPYMQLNSDIYYAIRDRCNQTINNYNDVLYSKTYISDDLWERLKENLGGDIQIGGFLPASETKEEPFNSKDKVFITIIVPSFSDKRLDFSAEGLGFPSKWDVPFVELKEYSNFKDIREVLFNVDSRFRILEIEDNTKDPRQLVLLYEAYSVKRFISLGEPYIRLPNLNLIAECRYCKSTILNQNQFIYVDLESEEKVCEECSKKHHQINCDQQQPLLYIASSEVKRLQNCLGASIRGLLMKSKNISKLPFYGYRCVICKSKNSSSYYTCLNCPGPAIKFCTYCDYVRAFCNLSMTEPSKLKESFEEIVKIFNEFGEQSSLEKIIKEYYPNRTCKNFREFVEFLSEETNKLMELCKECQRLADDKDDKLENPFRSLIQKIRTLINNSKEISSKLHHKGNQVYEKKLFPAYRDYKKELLEPIENFIEDMKTLGFKGKEVVKSHKCSENELLKNKTTYCEECYISCVDKQHLLVLEKCPYTFWREGLSKEEYSHIQKNGEILSAQEFEPEFQMDQEGEEKITIQDSVENVAKLFEREVVWFELNISQAKIDDYSEKLKDISCEARFFGEPNKTIEEIKNLKNPILFVVSGGNMKVIEEVHKIEIVSRILIFGKEEEIKEEWKNKKSKFRCVNNLENLKEEILVNQKRLEFPAMIFNDEHTDQVEILHNCLRCLPKYNFKKQAKKDFLNLAKTVYRQSKKNMELIESFEQNYIGSLEKETLYWYTKETFVYKLTNNSLRLATPDSILYCCFFIDDLSQAIKNRYLESSQAFHGVLYQAAFISHEEWIKLGENVGRDIEMYGFLSTTKSLKVANFFGGGKSRILITILVPPGPLRNTKGFAEVSEFSEFEEEEIIFNIMSRFTVLEVNEEINGNTKIKNLVLLYGKRELKKYLTDGHMIDDPIDDLMIDDSMTDDSMTINQEKERRVFIETIIPAPERIQCRFCRLKMSEKLDLMFYASLYYTNGIFVCHACLETSKNFEDSPLLDRIRYICESPLLCLKKSICNSQTLKIKGFCMIYKNKIDFPFYGYQCAGCGQKNIKGRFYKCLSCPKNKWCERCFENNNRCQQKKEHLIVLETQPFSFWNEGLTEIERHGLMTVDEYIHEEDIFSQPKIFHQMGEYKREIDYYLTYLKKNESLNYSSKTVAIYKKLGYAYLDLGELEKAVESCQKSLEITKLLHAENEKKGKQVEIYPPNVDQNYTLQIETIKDNGGGDHDLVDAYNHLGLICFEAGKYDEAIEACLKSIEIMEAKRMIVLFEEGPHQTLSLVFNKLGQYENEIKYCLLHLEGLHSHFQGYLYDKIGLAYLRLGKFEQARQNFLLAFERRVPNKMENESTADLYEKFGMVYLEAKDYQTAIEYHLNALEIRKEIYGKEHVFMLLSYQNVGLTYYRQRKYQEAVSNYSIVLNIQISNKDDPLKIALTHENLGKAYFGLEKYQDAVYHHTKALEILESDPKQAPLALANSYENLGIAYSGFKKYSETIKFCMKSVEIKNKFGDEYDETFEECYTYLGIAFRGLNQYEKASEFIAKALRITIIENSDQNKQKNLQNLLEVVLKNATEKLNLKVRTLDVACLYRTLGTSCLIAKKYEEAIKLHSNALEIRKEILGYKHIDTASSHRDLAATYQDWQKYQEALENLSKALEILKLTLGDSHAEIASCYKNLGSLYQEWGNYQEAVENHSKALYITKLTKGDKDLETVDVYEDLGVAYWGMKRYKESLECNIKCLDIRKSILGEEHPDTASSYEYIGILYNCLEQYQDGLIYHLQALEIRKVTLDYRDLATASSYKHLGITYHCLKQYHEATKFMTKSLDIQKSILKSGGLEIATTYEKLGSVYHDWGKYKEAVDYHSKALEIRKLTHKDIHLEIASSYKEIGRAYYAWHKYQEALENHLKDLEIRKLKSGDEHPDTASSYENIGMAYHGLKQYEEAHLYISKALQILKLNGGNKTKLENLENLIGTIKSNLTERALNYQRCGSEDCNLGKFQEAIEKHSKALQIRKLINGEEHPDTASSYENIGITYNNLKEYNKAIEYCSKSLNIKKSLYGENHSLTETSFTIVGIGFWRLGEFEKAKEFLSKALNVLKLNEGDKNKIINLETLIAIIGKNSK